MTLQHQNAARWANAKLTRAPDYKDPVRRVLAAKDRYLQIQNRTGVHWVFIACVHMRESNFNFSRSLAQGDPWDKVSTHVPKGRGPFSSFEEAAGDAFTNCAPFVARNRNWSMPDLLTVLEAYNGLGYYHHGLPSPYVWAGTDQYTIGKYVGDGVFDPRAVDKQLGVAGLIVSLLQADPSITFPTYTGDTDSHTLRPAPTPATLPVLPPPHKPIPNAPVTTGASEPPNPVRHTMEEIWAWLHSL